MFKLDLSPTFRATVSIDVPDESGEIVASTFTGVFRRMTTTQLGAFQDEPKEGGAKPTDKDFARHILMGWDDVTSGGQPVPYSPEALTQLLDIPSATNGIISSYYFAQAGLKKKP